MEEKQQKTLERLTDAVEQAYHSPGKIFWRGFLFGLGKGIGSLIGWLLLIAILVWLIQITGIADAFSKIFETLQQAAEQLDKIPGFSR